MSDDNYYSEGSKRYTSTELWAAAAGLPSQQVFVKDLYLQIEHLDFGQLTVGDFLYEMQRVERADLQYPVILTPDGHIADGWHLILKATLQGVTSLPCVRLYKMPKVID